MDAATLFSFLSDDEAIVKRVQKIIKTLQEKS